VIACICAWLGVVLIVVALLTTHWLEADGFCQGLWKLCVASRNVEICASAADRGLSPYIVTVL